MKDDTFTFGAKRAGAQFILNNEATGGDGHFKAVPERFPDPSLPSGDGKFELGVYFVDGNNVTLKAILGGNTSIPVEVAIPCKGKPNKICLIYIGIKREQHGTTPIYFDTTNALWCGHTDNLNNWNMYRFDVSQEE